MKAFSVSLISLICLSGPLWGNSEEKDRDFPTEALSVGTPWDQMVDFVQNRLQGDFEQPLRIRPLGAKNERVLQEFSGLTLEHLDFNPHNKKFTAHLLLEKSHPKTTYPFKFHGQVVFLRRVPILKERLEAGEECCLEKIRWQFLEEDQRLKDVITDPELLKGATARYPIRPGGIPSRKNLKTHDQVEKGETVELVYQMKNLTITLTGGQVLTKGRIGETISVLNPITGKGGKPLLGTVEKNRRVRLNALS